MHSLPPMSMLPQTLLPIRSRRSRCRRLLATRPVLKLSVQLRPQMKSNQSCSCSSCGTHSSVVIRNFMRFTRARCMQQLQLYLYLYLYLVASISYLRIYDKRICKIHLLGQWQQPCLPHGKTTYLPPLRSPCPVRSPRHSNGARS